MPSAPPVTISPSGATATALSGVGSVTIVGAPPCERPDAQRHVVARGDQRAAVGREGDAVDVLLMAFEHARRAAGERPQPHGVVPRGRGERRAVGRHRERRRPAPCGLRARVAGCRLARLPDRDARILAAGDDAAVRAGSATAFTAPSWKRSTCSAALRVQRPADRRGVEAAGDRGRAVGRDRERAHRPAMAAQLRLRGQLGSQQHSQSDRTATMREVLAHQSSRGLHAERAGCGLARRRVAQRGEERLHRRPLAPALDQQEIVVLRRERQEAEPVESAPPARSRRPSRRAPAPPRRRPRCASAAGWRSRAAARRRAAGRSARACRRRRCG